MGPALTVAASLRCHECRARRAPLQADLVEQARLSTGPGADLLQLPTGRREPYQLAA
jgi:hypothetical protein